MFDQKKTRLKQIEERLHLLSEEGENTLRCIQEMNTKDLSAELPLLQLRLRRIISSYKACIAELDTLALGEGEETPEGFLIAQLKGMAAVELRWINDLAGTLDESRQGIELSDTMVRKAFQERLRNSLSRETDKTL